MSWSQSAVLAFSLSLSLSLSRKIASETGALESCNAAQVLTVSVKEIFCDLSASFAYCIPLPSSATACLVRWPAHGAPPPSIPISVS